jgi:FAD:protein FMN transferase
MKTKDIVSLFVLAAILGVAGWRWAHASYTEKQTAILLDTVVTINAVSHDKNVASVVSQALDLMRDYEARFSYTAPNSEIWRINHSDADSLEISDDLYKMLSLGRELYQKSDSLYDLSVGPLSDTWKFMGLGDSTDVMTVPPPDSLQAAKRLVGFYRVNFDEHWLKRPVGMRLNLGSIAKGYIVDRTVEFLQQHGVTSGWVQAGGDIRYFGKMRYQRTGIQSPRGTQGDVIAILRLRNITVDTSGDYERFFMVGNHRYHHILDPKTGYPSNASVAVTVLAPNGMLADALSTSIFLLGPEKGLILAASYPNVEVIVYTEENGALVPHSTPGFERYLQK